MVFRAPASLIGGPSAKVEMKVEDGSLSYSLGTCSDPLSGPRRKTSRRENGFVGTGDMIELRGGRYYFDGRRDGIINVDGRKVYPEEVEAVINRLPRVQMSVVKARRNPTTGAVATAEGGPRTVSANAETELIKS